MILLCYQDSADHAQKHFWFDRLQFVILGDPLQLQVLVSKQSRPIEQDANGLDVFWLVIKSDVRRKGIEKRVRNALPRFSRNVTHYFSKPGDSCPRAAPVYARSRGGNRNSSLIRVLKA